MEVKHRKPLSRIAIFLLSAAVLIFSVACSTASPAPTDTDKGITVVASFFPMYDLARKIAGDRAQVSLLVTPGAEPHSWEPTAADIVQLERADMFVYSGAGMEIWAQDVLQTLSNKELVVIEASAGITLIKGGHADHDGEADDEEEDDHEDEEYDPHVWLSPPNAKLQMANIRDGLLQADPDGAAVYQANYAKYAAEMDKLDMEYQNALAPYAGKEIIVAHEAFGYLCDAYGLVQLPVEGLTPDTEPDPARVADIIRLAKEHSVKVIFFEETASSKVAEVIADEIGARVDVLSPVAALDPDRMAAGEDYFSLMRDNLDALVAALSATS